MISSWQPPRAIGGIRARAPLRLGLAGGGTDVSPFSDEYGGLVLNATISKYAYATIFPSADGLLHLIAADTDCSWSGVYDGPLEPIQGLELHVGVFNRVAAVCSLGSGLGITVVTHSEAPPGSGLGSSSTMVVTLLEAFSEYLRIPFGEYDLARLAFEIERGDLGLDGGKQDHYAAAFGGFNFMEFYADRVIVNPLRLRSDYIAEFEASLVLFFTGVSRESAAIIREQTERVTSRNPEALEAMHRGKQEAVRMKEAILTGDFDELCRSMRDAWSAKKRMARSISNPHIDAVYDAALAAGARAGKVSGAGGGGFMMFLVDPATRPHVIRTLEGFSGSVVTAGLVKHGAHAWRIK